MVHGACAESCSLGVGLGWPGAAAGPQRRRRPRVGVPTDTLPSRRPLLTVGTYPGGVELPQRSEPGAQAETGTA